LIDGGLAVNLLCVSEKEVYVPCPVSARHGQFLHDYHASIFVQIQLSGYDEKYKQVRQVSMRRELNRRRRSESGVGITAAAVLTALFKGVARRQRNALNVFLYGIEYRARIRAIGRISLGANGEGSILTIDSRLGKKQRQSLSSTG
jgi:hypothetical protein